MAILLQKIKARARASIHINEKHEIKSAYTLKLLKQSMNSQLCTSDVHTSTIILYYAEAILGPQF